MSETSLLLSVQSKLNESFPGAVLSATQEFDFPVFTVKSENIVEIIRFLKEDDSMQYGFLTTLCGLHYPDNKGKELGVMYQLHSLPKNLRIRLKTFLPILNPEVASLSAIFSTANWMEREAYDFFGIKFIGHPDLRRILNMDDMVAFPLRKEFPLEDQTRDDKDDRFFGR